MNKKEQPQEELKGIEINDAFRQSFDLLERSGKYVFITGRAGTGKSTFLDWFRRRTRLKTAVLAPTGVAALNVRGETIHSFFGFRPDITPLAARELRSYRGDLYRTVDLIVIDEISMVRADLLDCVDAFLRVHGRTPKQPFGGVRMAFVGDLYQLPPVSRESESDIFGRIYEGPFFFNARVFSQDFPLVFLEMEKVYRHRDPLFLEILNRIRNNTVTERDLQILNTRVADRNNRIPDFSICLTGTNAAAAAINEARLAELDGRPEHFAAVVNGTFEKKEFPADEKLVLKKDAQVMLSANDSSGRWVNGSVGRIAAIHRRGKTKAPLLHVAFADGRTEDVEPFTWELFRYRTDEKGHLCSDTIGRFTQYPLKLAWAVTVHKGQGKTFESVFIDLRHAFAPGQTYVALSRCPTLQGITLGSPIRHHHIFTDRRIVEFLTRYQYALSEERMPLEEKAALITGAIVNKQTVAIVYLKKNDEKSRRVVTPYRVGMLEHEGVPFLGMEGFCALRKEERVFRLDRILELKIA